MSITINELGKAHEFDVTKLEHGKAHNDGGNLFCVVSKNGLGAYWLFRSRFAGAPVKQSFGKCNTVSIAKARARATKWRDLIDEGIDPRIAAPVNVELDAAKPLFKAFALEQLARKKFKDDKRDAAGQIVEGNLAGKSRKHWRSAIESHFTTLFDMPVDAIDTPHIIKVLQPHWEKTPSLARALKSYLNIILKAARGMGYIDRGKILPTDNDLVYAVLGPLPRKGSIKGSHPALHYSMMPQFWLELRQMPQTISAKNLQLLILTALRPGESMKTDKTFYVDAEHEPGAKRLLIPGRVMKHEKNIPGDIPLTPVAQQIVEEMIARHGHKETLLFPGTGGEPGERGITQGARTMLKLLQVTLGYNGKDKPLATVHGMRASFRTWLQEETDHSVETGEYCLHHIKGDDAKEAYLRGTMWKKRKQALLDWERYVTSLERAQSGDSGNVVSFQAAA